MAYYIGDEDYKRIKQAEDFIRPYRTGPHGMPSFKDEEEFKLVLTQLFSLNGEKADVVFNKDGCIIINVEE